jgi:hypothetical protein
MSNVSKIQTRLKMIQAVCDLMDKGVSVSEISGIAITEHCSVDKMYINRYFGDLAELFMSTIQHLLTVEMYSMISSDVFPVKGTFIVHPHIEKAFKLATFLSGQEAYADRLTELGHIVSAAYAKQLQDTFGLKSSQALFEAKLGIMFIAGYLSFGKALDLGPEAMQEFFDLRLEGLKKRA